MTIATAGLHLRGLCAARTTIQGSSEPAIRVGGSQAAPLPSVTIEDLRLAGGAYGLSAEWVSDLTVRRLHVDAPKAVGVHLFGCTDCLIEDVRITDVVLAGVHLGAEALLSDTVTVRRIDMDDYQGDVGFHSQQSRDLVLEHVRVTGGGINLNVQDPEGAHRIAFSRLRDPTKSALQVRSKTEEGEISVVVEGVELSAANVPKQPVGPAGLLLIAPNVALQAIDSRFHDLKMSLGGYGARQLDVKGCLFDRPRLSAISLASVDLDATTSRVGPVWVSESTFISPIEVLGSNLPCPEDLLFEGNRVHAIPNPGVPGALAAIFVGACGSNVIRGNHFTAAGDGIQLESTTDIAILGNVIRGGTPTAVGYVKSAIGASSGGEKLVVSANHFIDSEPFSLWLQGAEGGPGDEDVTISHNLLVGGTTPEGGSTIGAIFARALARTTVEHNVIIGSEVGGASVIGGTTQVRGNRVLGVRFDGLSIFTESATVEDNVVALCRTGTVTSSSGQETTSATGLSASADDLLIQGNHLVRNAFLGMAVWSGTGDGAGGPVVRSNRVEANERGGLTLMMVQPVEALVSDNDVGCNRRIGLSLDESLAKTQGNRIHHTRWDLLHQHSVGVLVGTGSELTAEKDEILDSERTGVCVMGSSEVTLNGVVVRGSGRFGLDVHADCAAVVQAGSEIADSAHSGISVRGGTAQLINASVVDVAPYGPAGGFGDGVSVVLGGQLICAASRIAGAHRAAVLADASAVSWSGCTIEDSARGVVLQNGATLEGTVDGGAETLEGGDAEPVDRFP